MNERALRTAARRSLRDLGPQTPQELHHGLDPALLELDGAALDVEGLRRLLLDEVVDEFAAFPLADGRLCDLDALLDGLTLTHLVTEEERAEGAVALVPDLAALHLLSPDGRTFPLADGTTATLTDRTDGWLLGPDGWLLPHRVVVARVVDGRIEVSGRDEEPPVDVTVAERLGRTLQVLRGSDRYGVDEVELLLEARARYPRLLDAPGAPLTTLLTEAGLRSTDGGLLTDDEDDADDLEPVDDLVAHLREDHRLQPDEVRAVMEVHLQVQELQRTMLEAGIAAMQGALAADDEDIGAARDPVDGEQSDTDVVADAAEGPALETALDGIDRDAVGAQLTVALTDTEAAMALVEDLVGTDPLAAACMLGLLTAAPPSRDRRVRANAVWVRARMTELAADDHAEVEVELRRARELDDGHGPAAFDLARYLSDRGQAGAALGLLRRIEGPNVDETIDLLAPYAKPGPMSAARNDPCPCGSGRKHKVCCQARGGWPLQHRIDWVWHKVMTFLASPYAHEMVDPIAAACGQDPDDPSVHHIAVLNLALFEGGLLTELCDVRGALLPADELDLLRSWSQVRAGAYELLEVDRGSACTVLDLRTGERTTFVDRSVAADLEPGAVALAWLLDEPDGPTPSYGLIVVPDHRRRDLLDLLDEEPGPVELARWYRGLSAPPQLMTTAGDPMVAVTRTYEVADGPAARAALAAHLHDDGGTLTAHEERDRQRGLEGSAGVGHRRPRRSG